MGERESGAGGKERESGAGGERESGTGGKERGMELGIKREWGKEKERGE